MKKHLLILASLVFGIGQLFAETAPVTFSFSELNASLPQGGKKVNVPYTWTVSPGHVSATIAKLDGTEGILIASKIADRVGITRSVIVNALRKFESADLIETRSLGMKGTFIKIKNEYLLEELNKH